ncbi:MAG: hypothetical protein LBK58_00500 [Prevotellaceae bacterium]|jgi:hypothetical protein|nr:hypothetical protein [Prevotellaceae bacterium]
MNEYQKSRIAQIRNCASIYELSFVIWTKEMEEAMRSSREIYRAPFRLWVEEYMHDLPHTQWQYETPYDLANDIWKYHTIENRGYYEEIKDTLIEWIENNKLLNTNELGEYKGDYLCDEMTRKACALGYVEENDTYTFLSQTTHVLIPELLQFKPKSAGEHEPWFGERYDTESTAKRIQVLKDLIEMISQKESD